MVRWERFDPADYEISFDEDKLAAHGVSAYDVMEVLVNGMHVIRNKRTKIATACEAARTVAGRWN